MKEKHPSELDLARLSDGENGDELADHVRWCSSCRRILADYDWLQGELAAALDAKSAAAPIADPDWEGVRSCLSNPERDASNRLLLVAAGASLIAFVMLAAPATVGRRVQAQTTPGGAVSEAPSPVLAPRVGAATEAALSLTMTPVDRERVVSLPFVPPPTPPEPTG